MTVTERRQPSNKTLRVGFAKHEVMEMARIETIQARLRGSWRKPVALALLLLAGAAGVGVPIAAAEEPDLAKRVAALEAYVGNGDPSKGVASPVDTGVPGPGHNAWMMTSTALVLFMTLPGLALFYGGLVRRKNILSVCAQCFGCAGMVTILWFLFGYSFAFAHGSPFMGGTTFAMLQGRHQRAEHRLRVLGLAERVLDVPADVRDHHPGADRRRDRRAHEVLGHHAVPDALDARGLLPDGAHGLGHRRPDERRVERRRQDQSDRLRRRHRRAHDLGLVGAGAVLDARQAHRLRPARVRAAQLDADADRHRHALGRLVRLQRRQRRGRPTCVAANAFTATTLATAVAATVWPALEWFTRGKPTVLGFCSGAVAGLVVITPGAGFVTPDGAVIIGVLAGVDAVLRLHQAQGGARATTTRSTPSACTASAARSARCSTGFFADADINANLKTNLANYVGSSLWMEQVKAIGLTLVLAVVGTAVIATVVKAVLGLRPDAEGEEAGLDYTDHGESGYHMDEDEGRPEHADRGDVRHAGAPRLRRRAPDRSWDSQTKPGSADSGRSRFFNCCQKVSRTPHAQSHQIYSSISARTSRRNVQRAIRSVGNHERLAMSCGRIRRGS